MAWDNHTHGSWLCDHKATVDGWVDEKGNVVKVYRMTQEMADEWNALHGEEKPYAAAINKALDDEMAAMNAIYTKKSADVEVVEEEVEEVSLAKKIKDLF